MKNLLLPDSTYRRLDSRLDEFDIQAVRMRGDGSLIVADQPVTAEDFPIQLAWLSVDVFIENLLADFVRCLADAPQLKWMQTISAGLDNPLYRHLIERKVRVCNSAAAAPPIAEYVVASVIYRYQNVSQRIKFQQQRQWKSTTFREIYDSNWLIVGFGNIGSRVGRIVRGFEGHVTGVKRTLVEHEHEHEHEDADRIITFDNVLEVLPSCDVVVLACALTDETKGLVDEAFLGAMKEGAILVNIARGGVVDEMALLEVLDGDRLDCAILDVFQHEPLPVESQFWHHPRVLMTPHASSRGRGTRDRWVELFFQNLDAYLKHGSLRNEVDLAFFKGQKQ